MAIKRKIILALGATIVASVVTFALVTAVTLSRGYADLEENHVREDARRFEKTLDHEVQTLGSKTADWSSWDDTYAFVADGNDGYVKSNLGDATFTTLGINLILFYDASGGLVYGKAFDATRRKATFIAPGAGVLSAIGTAGTIKRAARTPVQGVITTPVGPLIISARPILTSAEGGPSRGVLVFGRYFDRAQVDALAALTSLGVEVRPYNAEIPAGDWAPAARELTAAKTVYVKPLSRDRIAGYTVVRDVDGTPALVAKITTPRDIHRRGRVTLFYVVGAIVVLGLVYAAVTLVLVEKLILFPIARLGDDVRKITPSDALLANKSTDGNNEVARLSQAVGDAFASLKCTENKLRESERRLRAIIDAAEDCIFVKNKDLEYTHVNAAMERLFGLTAVQLVGKRDADLFGEEVAARVAAEDARVLAGDIIRAEDTKLIAGTSLTFHVIKVPLRTESGEVVGVCGVARDVTQRKRNDEALQDSERRYRLLAENVGDVIWTASLDLRVTYASPSATKLYGYPGEQLIGRPLDGFLTPAAWETVRRVFREELAFAAARGKDAARTQVLTLEQIRADGSTFWTEVKASLSYDDNGAPSGILGVTRDVTERHAAEAALRASEERYRFLFNTANDAVVIHGLEDADKPSRYIEVNDVMCGRLGYTRDELLRLSPLDIVAPERRAAVSEAIRGLIADEHAVFEMVHLARDGRRIPVEISAHLFTHAGEPTVLSIIRDITERKKADEELRRARDELEERVRERTEAITQAVTELRASEENFRVLVENFVDVLIVYDPARAEFDYANPAAAELFGVPPEDLLCLNPRSFCDRFVYHEDRDAVFRGAAQAFALWEAGSDAPLDVEYRVQRPNGEVRWVRQRSYPTRRPGGPPGKVYMIFTDIAARKAAQKALTDSERFLASVFSSITDGLNVLDKDMRIISVNKVMEEWYAHAMPLVGKKCYEAYHGRDERCDVCPTVKTLATGETAREFVPMRGPGGVIKGWIDLYSFPLVDQETGELRGAIEYVRDITAQRKAEEEARATEERYRRIVETTQEGIWMIDAAARTTYVNAQMATMLGYTPEEMLGREVFDFMDDEARSRAEFELAAGAAEISGRRDFHFRRQDGSDFWAALSTNPITTNDGRFVGALAMATDITERRRQENVVSEQRWILENVLNNMSELVYVCDPADYEILFVNEPARRSMGAEVVGQKCYRAMWGLTAPCRGCAAEKLMTGEVETGNREGYNELLGKWLSVNLKTVTWLDGRRLVCSVASDVSERKVLEEEIVAHNKALNKTVQARTAELALKNQELESFAYSVSHDLRAPLRSLEGFSRALLEDYGDRIDGEGQDYLNRIIAGAVRMDNLINDLLTYSRLGRRGVEFSPVDMNEVVASSLQDLDDAISRAEARVAVDGTLPTVHGDRSMLVMLMDNLIGNAVKFKRPGVPPRVSVAARAEDGVYVFAVRDNGIGFDPEYRERIFNIFQRLHDDSEYPGTGIGLASAQKVVAIHGGRIWCESERDQGAIFYFELPNNAASDQGVADGDTR